MDKTIATLLAEKEDVIATMESMLTEVSDRDFSEEETEKYDELEARCKSIDNRIKRHEALLNAKASRPAQNMIPPKDADEVVPEDVDFMREARRRIEVPTSSRWANKLVCFKTKEAQVAAYKQGQILRAIFGSPKARQWCTDNGLTPYMVHQEGVNTQGGYLVLPEFDAEVVNLAVQYGTFERLARSVPMTSDVKYRDRKTSGLTLYAVGEGDAGTESTMAWDQFSLTARKWMALTRISNELNADAVVSIMDELADDVALASATKKDQAGFIGDGTSTYHGVVGINQKLADINGVDEGGGIELAAGNVMSEVVLTDLNGLVARLPDYPGMNTVWVCSKYFYHAVMEKLLTAAGGNTVTNIEEGGRRRIFLGYPVEFCDAFPKSDANSQVLCILGDIRKSSDFGDRAQTTLAVSDSAYVGSQSVFARDQLALRWTERWDINNHDLGTASAAGPVVGLMSAAS